MSIEPLYRNYYNVVTNTIESVKNSGCFDSFKANSSYQQILEHVTIEIGCNLLQQSRIEFQLTDEEMNRFIIENDRIGNPTKKIVPGWNLSEVSPSCFRYIYHSCIILQHILKLNITEIDIVEIGGGYGGLCLALSLYAHKFGITISKYHFIDLPNITKLQKLYMEQYNPSFTIDTHYADTFGKNIQKSEKPLYLISCYALTEIDKSFQNNYFTTLLPKIDHGFIINNGGYSNPPNNFNKEVLIEKERPIDTFNNTFWYF